MHANINEASSIQSLELEERLWLDATLSKFDDILRVNFNKSLEEFSEIIMYHLSRLLGTVRGAFFVVDTDEKILWATGTYGCLLKNLKYKRFEIGEGPIGQAVKSKEILYFENLPTYNSYVNTSLAELNSTFLIIVPLMFNEEVYGAIELSQIKKLEPKYFDFLKRLSKNVASMLQSIQNNLRTRKLLTEAQQQAEILRAQEEELRQNMEELQATQEASEHKQKQIQELLAHSQAQEEELRQNMEELQATQEAMANKQIELEKNNQRMIKNEQVLTKSLQKFREKELLIREQNQKIAQSEQQVRETLGEVQQIQEALQEREFELDFQLKVIDQHLAIIHFDTEGYILDANETFLELTDYTIADLKDKHHSFFVGEKVRTSLAYTKFWDNMKAGKSEKGHFRTYRKDQSIIWLNGSYMPLQNRTGEVKKISLYAFDVTELKEKEQQIRQTNDRTPNPKCCPKKCQRRTRRTPKRRRKTFFGTKCGTRKNNCRTQISASSTK